VARGKQAGAPLIGPPDWVPIDVALAQIKALVGYAEPSMRELHRDLCGGQLVGASRRIDRETGQEVHEVHKPPFWDQVAMREFQEHVKVDHPPPPRPPARILCTGRRWWFFVRRRELDKRYKGP